MGVPGTLQCSMIPVYVNVKGKTRLQEKKRERIVDDGLYSIRFGSVRFDSSEAHGARFRFRFKARLVRKQAINLSGPRNFPFLLV